MSKVVPFIASNLNLLKDKAFLEFLNSNQLDDSTANELKGPVHQPSTEKPVLRYQPPSEKNQRISSLRPNAALLWALIDDSPLNAEEHEKAVDIMKAWNPNYPNPIPATPWKGMIWRGEVGQDRMWDGSQWVDQVAAEANSAPICQPAPSEVSEELTQRFMTYPRSTMRVSPEELNAAYEVSGDDHSENLWVTIAAYIRSPAWMAQCRNLIMRQPEIWMEVDDIFQGFTVDLTEALTAMYEDEYENKDDGTITFTRRYVYRHERKLDHFIARLWGNFMADQKQEVFDYINDTRFVNNTNVEDPGFRYERNCVNTSKIASDDSEADKKNVHIDRSDVPITGDDIWRDLNKPETLLGQLSKPIKDMLRDMAAGLTQEEIAEKQKKDVRTIGRWLKKARTVARKTYDLKSTAEDAEDSSEVFDISASAEFHQSSFLTPKEAAAYLGGLNSRTVARWAREGYLPAIPIGEGKRRLWRFLEADLEAWMLARRQGGQIAA